MGGTSVFPAQSDFSAASLAFRSAGSRLGRIGCPRPRNIFTKLFSPLHSLDRVPPYFPCWLTRSTEAWKPQNHCRAAHRQTHRDRSLADPPARRFGGGLKAPTPSKPANTQKLMPMLLKSSHLNSRSG